MFLSVKIRYVDIVKPKWFLTTPRIYLFWMTLSALNCFQFCRSLLIDAADCCSVWENPHVFVESLAEKSYLTIPRFGATVVLLRPPSEQAAGTRRQAAGGSRDQAAGSQPEVGAGSRQQAASGRAQDIDLLGSHYPGAVHPKISVISRL